MKRFFYIALSLMFTLVSCGTQKSAYSIGGEWELTNLDGKQITPTSQTPFIGIDLTDGKIYGFTGCNRLTGTIDIKKFVEGTPDFSKMGMTRMLCPDDTYERSFMQALEKVKSSEISDKEMCMKDATGKVILVFKKKK